MDRLDVGAVYCQVWEGCAEQDFRDEEAREGKRRIADGGAQRGKEG